MTDQSDQPKDELMTMLKRHRLAKGLTLLELGKRIGVTAGACSAWETGRNNPHPKVIPKLARVLDVNAIDLTKLISPENPGTDAK